MNYDEAYEEGYEKLREALDEWVHGRITDGSEWWINAAHPVIIGKLMEDRDKLLEELKQLEYDWRNHR